MSLTHTRWAFGGCPLVARQIACDECRNADARYTDVDSYLKLNTAPYLFVYGTLKSGHANAKHLDGATFVGADRALGYATSWLAPLATEAEGYELRGEVYTDITEAMWARLDVLESYYRRERIVTASGLDAIIYVANGPVPLPLREEWK